MKKTIFTGAATALITPFDKKGKIDYNKFAELVEWQISQGINALVVCGTTGEASCLSDEEHRAAISFVVQKAAGRVPVIAGTGSNDTDYAISLTKHAEDEGADAILLVTPYYNKATQKGLIKMYNEIADSTSLPIIIYNVPSRTGVNIEPSTYVELAKHPNIVAIKEAGGNISKIAETALLVGDKLDIYSGNDDQIVPVMSLGGKGVISVLSNVLPKETVAICEKFLSGDVVGSRELQLKLLPLIDALFCEVNPIPVKSAMAKMGFTENVLRSPLYPIEPDHDERLTKCMIDAGVKF